MACIPNKITINPPKILALFPMRDPSFFPNVNPIYERNKATKETHKTATIKKS